MLENYTDPEQIATDESFIAWYNGSDPLQAANWETWITEKEENRQLVNQAVALLNALRIKEKRISEEELAFAHERVLSGIKELENNRLGKIVRFGKRYKWLVAASVSVVLVSGYLLINTLKNTSAKIISEYGQVKEQHLPDGTDVIINANSNLTYANLSQENKDREVWLKGEAFFHVSKTTHKRRFIVHTDHFDIVVTGTQFNVVNRGGLSNVLLREGSVIIETSTGKEIKMAPGDYVEYSDNDTKRKVIKSDSLIAWKDKKLVFDNTSLAQVVNIIHEHYGVDIKLSGDNLSDKTISGMLPNDNLDVLLQAINATNDLEVIQSDGIITIRSRQ